MKDMTDKERASWLSKAVSSIAGGLFGKAVELKKKHKRRLEKAGK